MIKNLVRQRALQRLAGRAHLTGTGMALPWPIFEQANLGGSNIVEDLALGLELAERSAPPMLVEEATVWSPAASAGGTLVQRRRWEGGFLATMLKTAPGALVAEHPASRRARLLRGPRPVHSAARAARDAQWSRVRAGTGCSPCRRRGVAGDRANRNRHCCGVCRWRWRGSGKGGASRRPRPCCGCRSMSCGSSRCTSAFARRGAPKDWLRTGR